MRLTRLLGGALLLAGTPLPASRLAVRTDGGWREFWRSANAPVRWTAPDPALARAARWRPVAAGVWRAELLLAGSGEAWRTRVVAVRVDPRRVRLTLAERRSESGLAGAWTLDDAPPDAVVALNAGQFDFGEPWGWVVADGAERGPPATGPLSSALVVDTAGNARLVAARGVAAVRDSLPARSLAVAVQSYPTLLAGGEVPAALRSARAPIDLAHRDARLAVGLLPDGSLLFALTRFDAFGARLGFVPLGLTVPEMAAVMGGLGARDAVLLDGGISAQLLVRDAAGAHRWAGTRAVPLALVARPRR